MNMKLAQGPESFMATPSGEEYDWSYIYSESAQFGFQPHQVAAGFLDLALI